MKNIKLYTATQHVLVELKAGCFLDFGSFIFNSILETDRNLYKDIIVPSRKISHYSEV